jgi:hypothetical protein
VNDSLPVDVSALAASQVRAAEMWWRDNRPKAPGAIRAELERASSLIALQPEIGSRARNIALPGVRRLHLARSPIGTCTQPMVLNEYPPASVDHNLTDVRILKEGCDRPEGRHDDLKACTHSSPRDSCSKYVTFGSMSHGFREQ